MHFKSQRDKSPKHIKASLRSTTHKKKKKGKGYEKTRCACMCVFAQVGCGEISSTYISGLERSLGWKAATMPPTTVRKAREVT